MIRSGRSRGANASLIARNVGQGHRHMQLRHRRIGRDGSVVCVVEDPGDIAMIERSGGFNGRYHALMGRLSPMKGQGADSMRIEPLLQRIEDEHFSEVILALSTDVEGDATAALIADLLKDSPVRVTRLAFGLPAGSGVGYSDPVTLARAIRGRTTDLSAGTGSPGSLLET